MRCHSEHLSAVEKESWLSSPLRAIAVELIVLSYAEKTENSDDKANHIILINYHSGLPQIILDIFLTVLML